jgi:hypothetical protein
MRKLLLLPLLLALAYVAWPLWSAWQLRSAVKARDLAGIEQRVDWPTLRANLKRTIGANLRDETRTPEAGSLGKVVRRTLGPIVADRLIDVAVTPRTLAAVLAGRLQASDAAREAIPPDSSADTEAASDPLSPRRLRWAFFETPTRFRIEVADRRDPSKRVVSVLALQGLGWKLVDVYYRATAGT